MRTILLLLLAVPGFRDGLREQIDRESTRKWKSDKLAPPPLADDYEFFRRIHLDLLGRLPRPDEIRTFADDPGRAIAIDRLLESPEAARYWADRWVRLLLTYDLRETDPLVVDFASLHRWLERSYAENLPYDRFMTALIAAEGERDEHPEGNYLVKFTDPKIPPVEVASRVTQLFLGLQIQCAQCHDHPYEKWTQKDFWGMAAFFSNLRSRTRQTFDGLKTKLIQVEPVEASVVGIVDEGWKMTPKFLDGRVPEKGKKPREALAHYLVSMEGRQFAKAFVEREWSRLLGEPAHPELVEILARDFEGHRYDVRRFLRGVLESRAYQMSCRTAKGVAHRRLKPQGPIEFLNNFEYALDLSSFFQTLYDQFKDNKDLPESYRTPVLFRIYMSKFIGAILGPEEKAAGNPRLALKLMNNKDLQGLVRAHWGNLKRTLEKLSDAAERLEELFLTLASRPPDGEERDRVLAYLRKKGNEASAYEDIYWVLLNSPDFFFNH